MPSTTAASGQQQREDEVSLGRRRGEDGAVAHHSPLAPRAARQFDQLIGA